MKKLLFTTLFLLIAALPAAAVTTIHGVLAATDTRADDSFGYFYYDGFAITVDRDTSVTLKLTAPDFQTWLAAWGSPVLPQPLWETPSANLYTLALNTNAALPGAFAEFAIAAVPGTFYHVAVATNQYMPTPMGAYTLTLTPSDPGANLMVSSVPEPSSLLMLLAGGLLLTQVVARRRARV